MIRGLFVFSTLLSLAAGKSIRQRTLSPDPEEQDENSYLHNRDKFRAKMAPEHQAPRDFENFGFLQTEAASKIKINAAGGAGNHAQLASARAGVLQRLEETGEIGAMTGEEVDAMMYSETYKPHPGHEMHFDFDGFRKVAEGQGAFFSQAFAKEVTTTTTYANQTETVGTTAWSVSTTSFMQACLEINVCANQPEIVGSPNICGQFGVDLGVSYTITQTRGAGWTGTLKVTGGVNAGISAGLTNVFVVTFYLFGAVEWEFDVKCPTCTTSPYGSVYDALVGALKSMMMKSSEKANAQDKMIARAQKARESYVKELAASDGKALATTLQGEAQIDELKGLSEIHRSVLLAMYNGLKPATSATEANLILQQALYRAVWLKEPKAGATDIQKMMTINTFGSDDLKCRDIGDKKQYDNILLCAYLKYGAILGDGAGSGVFATGISKNVLDSVPVLYKEIWSTTPKSVWIIRMKLAQWFMYAKKVNRGTVIGAAWDQVQSEVLPYPATEPAAVPGSFTKYRPSDQVQEVNSRDPCATARKAFQTLATPAAQLKQSLVTASASKIQWLPTTCSITGGYGATIGTARVGYCTLDSNSVQARYAINLAWNVQTGWAESTPSLELWLAWSAGSFFQIHTTMKLDTTDKDETGLEVLFLGCLPSSTTDTGDDPVATADDTTTTIINPTGQEFLSGVSAEAMVAVVKAMVKMMKQVYDNVKAMTAEQLMTGFLNLLKTAFTPVAFTGIQTALPPAAKTATAGVDFAKIITAMFSVSNIAQTIATALLKNLGGMEMSTMLNIGLALQFTQSGKIGVTGSIAQTKVFKLAISGALTFYVIWGTELEIKTPQTTWAELGAAVTG